jgi:hypothetical protein
MNALKEDPKNQPTSGIKNWKKPNKKAARNMYLFFKLGEQAAEDTDTANASIERPAETRKSSSIEQPPEAH